MSFLFYPLPMMRRRASRWPSNVAQSVGVIPSSSFELQSFLVASFSMSNFPSRAALFTGKQHFKLHFISCHILIDKPENQDRTFCSDSITPHPHKLRTIFEQVIRSNIKFVLPRDKKGNNSSASYDKMRR